MSKPIAHLDFIAAELDQMASDGHFNNFEASIAAGAARHELSILREILEELERKDSNP